MLRDTVKEPRCSGDYEEKGGGSWLTGKRNLDSVLWNWCCVCACVFFLLKQECKIPMFVGVENQAVGGVFLTDV